MERGKFGVNCWERNIEISFNSLLEKGHFVESVLNDKLGATL